ncbi:MAG: tRNA (guanosine(46)-N7)-methyltransferase TrmB [Candidatus Gracilibacteria bacterium]|nr:tRNA (guanosine(46)-N7)-methyltransferase TrmB [Candidatus Gracilibacteria bacterium]
MRFKNQAKEEIKEFPELVFGPEKAANLKGNWSGGRKNSSTLFLEICMGAGRFICTMAERNPQDQFLGLEIKEERTLKAVKKVLKNKLQNIRFICADFRDLREFFELEELDGIYINFSDPWPKKRHHKRRASTLNMLQVYYDLLKPGAFLQIKHDNPEFIAFTLEHLEQSKFKVVENREIPPDDPDNIITEYEQRWRGEGRRVWLARSIKSS